MLRMESMILLYENLTRTLKDGHVTVSDKTKYQNKRDLKNFNSIIKNITSNNVIETIRKIQENLTILS